MKKIFLIIVLIMIVKIINAQPWLENLPKNKSKKELTFYDYQNAFYTYWKPYNVINGYYYENGNKIKASGWKQFKRWEYNMEYQINTENGAFPAKSAQEIYKEYLTSNLQKSSQASSNWTVVGPSSSDGGYAGVGRINCIAFHPGNTNTYWVGAASGGLWVTTNNGSSWTCLTNNTGVMAVSDIIIPADYATSNTIYIATGDRDAWDNNSVGVLKSTNGGSTWSSTGLSYVISSGSMVNRLLLSPVNNQILIAATSNGVYKTTDGGNTWNTQLSSINFKELEYKPGDFNTLYGSTTGGSIYYSANGGTTWTQSYSNSNARRIELAVSANQAAWVYAIAANSSNGLYAILKSTDSGVSFSQVFDGSSKNMLGWASAGNDTGGQGWYDLCIAASPSNANTILIGGVNTWRSTDGGSTWSIVNHWWGDGVPAAHADKHNLVFRSNGDLFEGNDGGIYLSTNNGTNWTDKSNGMVISQMYKLGISQTTSSETIAGLQDNGTKLYSSGSWSDVKGGDGMECLIDYTNVNIQYGTYVNGQISKTTNHWGSSTEIQPSGAGDGAWVTPYIINPLNPQILYAGYADVWKTTNRGTSWTQISTINTSEKIRSMAIAPSDTSVLYIADNNNIWKTTNGGSSWTDITGTLPVSNSSITYITVKNNDANTLWVTMSAYNSNRIFQTVNGGTTWTNISAGLPEIPVYSIVQNKQSSTVQLYAGTELGVFFKNGSNNWETFNTGLPNVKVGEIEIYYASNPQLSKLRAATYGRGLWETPVYYSSSAMTYVSSTTYQTNTSKVSPGKTNQEIIGMEIVTSGNLNPLSLTSFTFNTTGSTNPSGDISNAKVFITSTNSFDTVSQFGSVINLPNGTFSITGNYTLGEGSNYFWLAYDVSGNATINNYIDAQCTSLTVGTAKTPTITNPSGNRQIGIVYCNAGSNQCDEYISKVTIGNINNSSSCSSGGYYDYTNLSTNIVQGASLSVNVSNGIAYSGDQCGVWVDWNNNGDFTDDPAITVSGSPGGGPYSAIINCPQGTSLGDKRMRIRIHYNNETTSPCGNAVYGEVEDYTLTVIAGCTPPTNQATAMTASNIANNSIILGWTRGNGNTVLVVGHKSIAVDDNPVSGTNYTANPVFGTGNQIGNENYVVYNGIGTSVNISNLVSGTTYYFSVYEYNTSGYCYKVPALSGNYTTTGIAYCTAGSVNSNYEYISNVTLGSINQTSSSVSGGYQDFTSQSTNIQSGINYSLLISIGNLYSSDQLLIWIDWNQDGDFTDADEQIYTSGTNLSSPHTTASFTAPAGALMGSTRMRIRLHDSSYGPNFTPCGNSDYGEVEDYTVNIIPAACTAVSITNQPTAMQSSCTPSSNINFSVTTTGSLPITYQWQYYNGSSWINVVNGTPTAAVYTNENTYNMSVSGIIPAATYLYRCNMSNCNSQYSAITDNSSLVVNPLPDQAGTITGLSQVCQGTANVTYSVPVINNANTYIWTLPSGATGNSSTTSINVTYENSAVSGNLSVKGNNACGYGSASSKTITVNTLPGSAGIINGPNLVCKGQNNVNYYVANIPNATSYIWTLPNGASGNSSTKNISVNYSYNAASGNISVKGSNQCGDSSASSLSVTVKTIPDMALSITGKDTVNQGESNVIYTIPIVNGASSYNWTLPPNTNGSSTSNSISLSYGNTSISGNLIVKAQNECGFGEPSSMYIRLFKQMNIKLFFEGFYSSGDLMMAKVQDENGDHFAGNITDTLSISLHNQLSPFSEIYRITNLQILKNGNTLFRIPAEYNQSYFIRTQHRNHLDTWSSSPVSLNGETIYYDFTTSASKAHGNNQKEVAPGVFAIYAGDVNQDGLVDGSDMSDTEISNNAFVSGYIVTDVNGDGLVDGTDMSIVETNNNNFVGVAEP